jgi:hypothetical protein
MQGDDKEPEAAAAVGEGGAAPVAERKLAVRPPPLLLPLQLRLRLAAAAGA